MIIILCFDYSDGLPVIEVKHIVGKLRLTTSNDIATNVDPTIRDLGLHRNVTLPSIKNDRSNITINEQIPKGNQKDRDISSLWW